MDHLIDLFEREQITLEILAEMGHEDLKQVGVSAYGFRHKILKGIAQLRTSTGIYRSNYNLYYQQLIRAQTIYRKLLLIVFDAQIWINLSIHVRK